MYLSPVSLINAKTTPAIVGTSKRNTGIICSSGCTPKKMIKPRNQAGMLFNSLIFDIYAKEPIRTKTINGNPNTPSTGASKFAKDCIRTPITIPKIICKKLGVYTLIDFPKR